MQCLEEPFIVKAPNKARRFDTALLFALDGKNQLRKHPIDIRRVVLRLGPENRRIGDEHHLARVAALRQHAKVDVADDAGAVVLAEEHCGNAVLQFLFADEILRHNGEWFHGWRFRGDIIAKCNIAVLDLCCWCYSPKQKK